MPDVNLLKDTDRPDQPSKPEPRLPQFAMTDPAAGSPSGLGGFFRGILKRRSSGAPRPLSRSTPTSAGGKMSLGQTNAQQRILTETKKASRPSVIPLPDEETGYNVNLLTEDLVSTFSPRQKLIQLGLAGLVAIALVAAAYGGLRFYSSRVTKQVTSTKQELIGVQAQVSALKAEQTTIASTAKKLSAVKTLLDRHIRWTKFFTKLEQYTLPSVTYGSSFSGDITGSMALSASTSTFDEVAKQYLVFEQAVTNHDFISTFSITGATLTKGLAGDQVNFTVSFTIIPEILENPPVTNSATP